MSKILDKLYELSERPMSPKKKNILLVVYFIAIWYIFSFWGFLPRCMSLPVSEKAQKSITSFYITGYGDFSEIFLNIENDTIPAGVFQRMDLFGNGNLYDSKGVYNPEVGMCYIATPTGFKKIDFDNGIELVAEIPDKQLYSCGKVWIYSGGNKTTTKFYIDDELWYENEEWGNENDICQHFTHKDEHGELIHQTMLNYEKASNILEKQETEPISMRNVAFVLRLVNRGILLGWFPEEHTAVFKTIDTLNKSEVSFTTYNALTKECKTYDLEGYTTNDYVVPLSSDSLLIYRYNENELEQRELSTGNIEKIAVQVPTLSKLNYRIQKNGNCILVGVMDTGNIYIYSTVNGRLKDAEIGSTYMPDGLIMDDMYFNTYHFLEDGGVHTHSFTNMYKANYP